MADAEIYTTQHLTSMLTDLLEATKKGAISREACNAANNCVGEIIMLASLRVRGMEKATMDSATGDDLQLGATPALKPFFDSIEAHDSQTIIAEVKRIRSELKPMLALAGKKVGPTSP